MRVKVTYIYHSCFLLEMKKEVFVFDYPPKSHLSQEAQEAVWKGIKDKDIHVFISHSHPDHFSSDIDEFPERAKSVNYVLSYDVYTLRDRMDLKGEVIEAEAGGEYDLKDYTFTTFQSNDAGVAYLIEKEGITFYYGGDLARWDWEEWNEEKRRRKVEVFRDVLNVLEKEEIDIAFTNMDERLEGWAGPVEFMDTVRPGHFVPMHTFGNEGWVVDLSEEIEGMDHPTIFEYERPGDQVIWDI